MLGPGNEEAAKIALKAYPGGLQIGGGLNDRNGFEYLDAGASHLIFTSYVVADGVLHYDRLKKLLSVYGRKRIVLDLSCRKKADGQYYVVSNRWQTFTDVVVNDDTLNELAMYADEFLVHAVDVEGKQSGIQKELVALLGDWGKLPITYAGGVHSFADLEEIKLLGNNHLNVTIGSALDLFGGTLKYEDVLQYIRA